MEIQAQEPTQGPAKPRLVTGAELAVIQELRAKGVQPTVEMVAEILANRQGTQPENVPDSAESQALEETAETPEAPPERKRPGRPPKEPPWLQAAAKLVAEGATLRKALRSLGIALSLPERKNVYRWRRFRELVERCRREMARAWPGQERNM